MKATVYDPWRSGSDDTSTSCLGEGLESSLCFEDSFVPSSDDGRDDPSTTSSNDRLPDSAEYLASLENKLARLKSKRNSKDLVKSIQEKNRSSMMHFLSEYDRNVLDDDFILDTPVSSSYHLMRHVAPGKQALTVGELVELLKADQLAQTVEQEPEGIKLDESKPN